MEEKLRQALVISRGSFMTFVDRPLSAGLLVLSLILVVAAILPSITPEPGAGVPGRRLTLVQS